MGKNKEKSTMTGGCKRQSLQTNDDTNLSSGKIVINVQHVNDENHQINVLFFR